VNDIEAKIAEAAYFLEHAAVVKKLREVFAETSADVSIEVRERCEIHLDNLHKRVLRAASVAVIEAVTLVEREIAQEKEAHDDDTE
jgi:hypothetical protein